MKNPDMNVIDIRSGLFGKVNADGVLNMVGVILFYVVVFVAFSVFAIPF